MNLLMCRTGAPIHPKRRIADGAEGEGFFVDGRTYIVEVSFVRPVPFSVLIDGMSELERLESERRGVVSAIMRGWDAVGDDEWEEAERIWRGP